MTWEEKMASFLGVLVDSSIDDKKVFKYARGGPNGGA
jgi:hypothetical protein